MQFDLKDTNVTAKQQFSNFTNTYIDPFVEQWEKQELLPKEFLLSLAKSGYLGANIPKIFAGTGFDPITYGVLLETFGKSSMSLISLLTVHSMVSEAIKKWGTTQQQETLLPQLASGKILAAFALSEPNIGSDPGNIETIAIPSDNSGYLLRGQKKWISCGQIADLFLIFAKLDGKYTAFLLNRDNPNLTITPIQGMYGFRTAMLAELNIDDCYVASTDILGKIGFGFSHIANTALDHGRYCIAWGCVGLGQACLNAALSYTTKRKQFGVYLREHQLIQQMIANMTTDVSAARLLCMRAGHFRLQQEADLIMETSIAKYFASQMAVRAANDALQIHGANGCSDQYPIQRYLRDAKITEIIEGSSQLQQIIISQYAYQKFLFNSN